MVVSAARGTVFGFEVYSKLPLQYLRNGEGEPLEVVAQDVTERPGGDDKLLLEWKPPANSYSARLYFNGSRYLLWIAGSGWFRIDTLNRGIVVPASKDVARIEDKLWGIPALLCFIARGDHALHAAAVEVNGAAILIAGSNKLGRTALAAAFAAQGNRVLTQDLACVRLGQFTGLVPGPTMLRVAKDATADLDMSAGNGTWNAQDGYYSLDATRRGTSKPIPVRSIVLLDEDGNHSGLESIIPAQAISDLWSLSMRLPTEDDRARCFDGVADLASNVPVFKLQRSPIDSPNDLVERITATSLEYA